MTKIYIQITNYAAAQHERSSSFQLMILSITCKNYHNHSTTAKPASRLTNKMLGLNFAASQISCPKKQVRE